ncbi:beta propeller repeat protein [Salarchaeum japonicum]|uniref:Uncharacterized protein n=1 Tax=Salarchaeum japonicum TaxID=555573 RepID=A0AAV3T4R3_9EURY|nr:hypothetical protein [Salarchaeum japonicum]
MSELPVSRRTALKGAGGAAIATLGAATVVNTTTAASDDGWTKVSSPTEKTLYGVSDTVAGPVAVGKTGNILHRKADGWEVVYNAGPATRSNSLRTAAVTDDGKRVWFAGSSGAMGTYDVETGMKTDYSAPHGMTSTWEAITVTGARDQETVYVANGSGEVLKGTTDSEGCLVWTNDSDELRLQKPGSGSTIPAIDARENGTDTVHAIDTSGNAFETADAGTTWTDVGIPDAQVAFYDTISYKQDGTEYVYVTGGTGKVYRLDCSCMRWTPIDLGSKALRGIDQVASGEKLIVGSNGVAYEAKAGGTWESADTGVTATLYEASLKDHYDSPSGTNVDVVVGSGGTILER